MDFGLSVAFVGISGYGPKVGSKGLVYGKAIHVVLGWTLKKR